MVMISVRNKISSCLKSCGLKGWEAFRYVVNSCDPPIYYFLLKKKTQKIKFRSFHLLLKFMPGCTIVSINWELWNLPHLVLMKQEVFIQF